MVFQVKHKDEANHSLWKHLPPKDVIDTRHFPGIGRTEFLIGDSRGFRWVNSEYYVKV